MDDIIRVKHLVKRYKGEKKNAVNGISFSVQRGSFFALLGPNGAGKTTTVSVLSTTLAKTSGKVMIDGHNLDTDANSIRKKLGIIFQKPSLDQNLTAEENIRLHTVLYGLYPFTPTYSLMPAGYKDKVNDLAGLFGLKGSLFKQIRTFSGGMKRKLEIVRSLMHEPEIIILDEPTSGLDPVSRRSLWEYISTVRAKSNITILLTTHYLEEAENVDSVCIIDNGTIVSQGTPADIKKKLVRDFLILDAENRRKLKEEIDGMHLPKSKGFPLKVYLHRKSAQEVIGNITTPLSVLKIHTPTLEDAYLEIIGNHEKRD